MKKNIFFYLLLTVIVSGITSYGVISYNTSRVNQPYFYNEDTSTFHKTAFNSGDFPDFTFAAENAVKAVVHVKVVKKGASDQYSLFDFFFGYGRPQEPRDQFGAGSGVIITNDGFIITNNHVIDGADKIEVVLENNKSFLAKLVGSDSATDIALLKIEADNLPFLKFGNSDALRLGEWVLAIGNPYNLRSTVTAGIVSAKARSMPSVDGDFKIEAFIQTDAAVNQGNSGGALINIAGELVGINTAIASRNGSFAGYSFAVPTTIAKKVVEDIIDFGSVQRALLGITMQDIDGDLAKEKNLGDIRGVYIVDVVKDSPANKAGVKQGDVLTAINGVKVNSSPSVQEQINRFRPKDKISVEIIRDGKQKELSVVLEGAGATIAMLKGEKEGVFELFGAELKEAPKQKLNKLRLSSGIEVLNVGEGKFKESGVEPGFIITHINQIVVKNSQELHSVIQRSKRSILIEGVYPNGKIVYYGMGL